MTKHDQCKADILAWLRNESSGGSVSAVDVAVKLLHRYSINMCSKALKDLYGDGKLTRESKEKGTLYYRLQGSADVRVVSTAATNDIDATLELARAQNKALKQQLQATLAEQNDLLAAQKKTALSEIEAENQRLELEISQLEIENQKLRGGIA